MKIAPKFQVGDHVKILTGPTGTVRRISLEEFDVDEDQYEYGVVLDLGHEEELVWEEQITKTPYILEGEKIRSPFLYSEYGHVVDRDGDTYTLRCSATLIKKHNVSRRDITRLGWHETGRHFSLSSFIGRADDCSLIDEPKTIVDCGKMVKAWSEHLSNQENLFSKPLIYPGQMFTTPDTPAPKFKPGDKVTSKFSGSELEVIDTDAVNVRSPKGSGHPFALATKSLELKIEPRIYDPGEKVYVTMNHPYHDDAVATILRPGLCGYYIVMDGPGSRPIFAGHKEISPTNA